MALVLNIETSSHNCSVSISSSDRIISTEEKIFEEYSHSKSLHVHIERLFKKTNLKPSELSAVSVSQGPGSYTGLRIGISAAKGFCFALNIPMISLDTMRILAESVSDKNCYIISAMDARRDEIYFSVFKASKKETTRIMQTDIMILNSTSFSDFLNNSKTYFVGNCNEKIKKYISSDNAIYSPLTLPSSKHMAVLSYQKYINSNFVDISNFSANYIKDFSGKKI
jgi:tRNA threonylcarbamoyladenosine biosynthesis protein TsaB